MEIRKNGKVLKRAFETDEVVTVADRESLEVIDDHGRVVAILSDGKVRLQRKVTIIRHPRVSGSALKRMAIGVLATAMMVMMTVGLTTPVRNPQPVPLASPEIYQSGDQMINLVGTAVNYRLSSLVSTGGKLAQETAESFVPVYDVPLSEDLQAYIRERCSGDEARTKLVIAMISVESGFNPNAISGTDDYGLMQINSFNHEWLGETLGITDFFDPYQSIKAGTYMINGLIDEYGDVHLALMAYNMGERGAKKCWDRGLVTSEYSRDIVATMDELTVIAD